MHSTSCFLWIGFLAKIASTYESEAPDEEISSLETFTTNFAEETVPEEDDHIRGFDVISAPTENLTAEELIDSQALQLQLFADIITNYPPPTPDHGETVTPPVIPFCPNETELGPLRKRYDVLSHIFGGGGRPPMPDLRPCTPTSLNIDVYVHYVGQTGKAIPSNLDIRVRNQVTTRMMLLFS